MLNSRILLVAGILLASPVFAQTTTPPVDAAAAAAEADYTRTITQRADDIVAKLDLTDAAQKTRMRDIIANQYRALRDLNNARDADVKAAATPEAGNIVKNDAKLKVEFRHKEFLGQLGAEISPNDVDKVKDGLTYGVVPLTYGVYMEMLPNITQEQKTQIKAWLLEAREYAMDGGTSNEKHGWFGKYKGRINNYLGKAGIDMKQAEKDMMARKKAQPTAAKTEALIKQ